LNVTFYGEVIKTTKKFRLLELA